MIYKLLILAFSTVSYTAIAQNFNTDGNGIRNTIVGSIDGKEHLYISEIDGAISCYTINGKRLWRNPTLDPAALFEIVTVDINFDGDDDVLGVSANGHVYCWDSEGNLHWDFSPKEKVRLSEVAVIGKGEDMRIFAGGNNYKLYEINTHGKLVSESKIKGVVRKLENGFFTNSEKEELFLHTLKHDKFASEFFGFIDPVTKKVIKSKSINKVLKYPGLMVQDVSIKDINNDKKDEILIFGSGIKGACFGTVDGDLNMVSGYVGTDRKKQRYAYTFGTSLLPFRNEIVMQMGGFLFVVDIDGNLVSKSGKDHRGIIYNSLVYAPKANKLIGTGQIGGGNGLYFYDVSKKNWWNQKQKSQGRAVEVEENIAELYKQTLKYKAPSYQEKSEKEFVMITNIKEAQELSNLNQQTVKYVKEHSWKESTSRVELVNKIGEVAYKVDKRGKYKDSRQDVIDFAKEQERKNEPFTVWAGHGTDPFYLQIETLEAVIAAAPNTCYGFTYAEMANTKDPRVIHFVREYVPRLAKAIRTNKSKAKLYFRYKNMFWAADASLGLWQELFFSNKYNDILVPSAEDTNNRLQDINFAGRVGMFASGAVNDYAMRLVDDNPTSWRPLSPGGQRSVSPYLRNAAIMGAYGSKYALIFNIKYIEEPGMNVLFALMKSGVLPIVEKEDILSIGSWHLMKDIDEEYLEGVVNEGHNLCVYTPEALNAVVSVPGVNWCGANTPEHDYSKISMGVNYRWLNFIPEMPNGMVPITNVNFESSLKEQGTPYVVSDTKHGFVNGKKVGGVTFGYTMKTAVEKGGGNLLLKVKGASWSLIKLDKKHARLVLVDPGYIDPQERSVTITFQGEKPVNAIDILSKENISTKSNTVKLKVPAGSMRFIDLEYKKRINKIE